MRVHVKFFAIFREMVGIKNEWTEIAQGSTVEQLWKQYAARSPRVGNIRAAYAVNQRLVKPEQVLNEGDEVGFLPPVSGGARDVKRKTKNVITSFLLRFTLYVLLNTSVSFAAISRMSWKM